MVDIPKTKSASAAPTGMVLVPKNQFNFVTQGVEIEGNDQHGVDLQYPWEDHPQRAHNHTLELGPFYIDKYPVTNANYSAYLKATGYNHVIHTVGCKAGMVLTHHLRQFSICP